MTAKPATVDPEFIDEEQEDEWEKPRRHLTLAGDSEPVLLKFKPFGYQRAVLDFILNHDYSLYTPEIMLSGAVGSAKSVLLAHMAVTHCIRWPGACVAICRRSLGDLKKTLWKEIIQHISRAGCMVENVDFKAKTASAQIEFDNGSVIMAVTWGDKLYDKFKSLALSMIVIEELTENDDEFFKHGFKILKARLRRIAWVPENILVCATNPGEPDSAWYKYFITGSKKYKSRRVFYSLTKDNKYLDPVYYEQLLQDFSVLEAERYLEGKWISLEGEGIYHAYGEAWNFRDSEYVPDLRRAIHLTFDFNTADGKPQSSALYQFLGGLWHFYAESVIDKAAWCLDNLTDFEAQGHFKGVQQVIIHGDASGKARSSNSLRSNYDLIEAWFAERKIPCKLEVPRINPPLVTRWTTVNALCQNAKKQSRIFVYKGCPTLNQGMKLARKKEGTSIEDDSKPYQHITTALGYGVCYNHIDETRKSSTEKY